MHYCASDGERNDFPDEELKLPSASAVASLNTERYVSCNQRLWFRVSPAGPLEQHCASFSLFQVPLDNLNLLSFTVNYRCIAWNVGCGAPVIMKRR
jgi:hypothetical protein